MSGKTYHTSHGYTVDAMPRGIEVDLITRDDKGEVISTVVMDRDSATDLLNHLDMVV